MPDFTLRQLEYFRAIAEHGTIHAAAERLFVTPTATANGLTELERVLGVQLCVRRKGQGVVLTPAGAAVLTEGRSLLRFADELQRHAGSRGGELEGPLSIGCYSTLAPTILPALLEEYGESHPRVDVTFVDGTMDELHPLLERGALDVIITYRINLPLGLEEALLFETAVHVLLSADHALAHEKTVSLHQLEDEPLIMLDLPPSGRHTLDMLQRSGVRPNVRHRTSNFELVRSMVGRGLGYSLLVQTPHIDHSYEGRRVVAKPISPEFSAEAVVMVWPAAMTLTERARALVTLATATVGARQWVPGGEAAGHP